MTQILPCRTLISDRFPVASFVVQLPPTRVFEVACTTDPTLFSPGQRHRRSARNFFASRREGFMRAPAGEATWLLPSDQLQRFAGAQRIYYAIASYGSARGEDAAFTIDPERPESAPYVQLAPEFSGRTLDRSRVGAPAPSDRYGSPGEPPTWGADLQLASPRLGNAEASAAGYDDGFDPALWSRASEAEPEADTGEAYGGEPDGFEDGLSARAAYGGTLPGDDEDEPVADAAGEEPEEEAFGGYGGEDAAYGGAEPEGYEDPTALRRAGFYGSPIEVVDAAAPSDETGRFGGALQEEEEAPVEAATYDDDAEREAIAPVASAAGRDAAWGEDEAPMELEASASAAEPAGLPLTVGGKMQVVAAVAPLESGLRGYAAILRDVEFRTPGHPAYQRQQLGLSWGLLHFTQRSGDLGRVLQVARRRAPEVYTRVFGEHGEELLRVTTAGTPEARLAAVGGSPLWEDAWVRRFEAASQEPAFQHAQNEVAVVHLVDPLLPLARWLGLTTDRGLALLLDRVVHMGRGAGLRFLVEASGVIGDQAALRTALQAVDAPDLAAFVTRARAELPGDEARLLPTTPSWTPTVAACLIGRLRARNPALVPPTAALLERVRAASRGRTFEPRVRTLLDTRRLNDTVFAF